jgi:hypothetical protein
MQSFGNLMQSFGNLMQSFPKGEIHATWIDWPGQDGR